MGKALSYKDMIDIISMRTGKSERTVKQIYENVLDIIADELKNNSYIKLKDFGEIRAEKRGGGDEIFFNKFGLQEKRYVEPYYVLDIKTNQRLLDYINGKEDTFIKPYKRKQKNKDKETAYADFLDSTEESEFDEYLYQLTKSRKAHTNYINAWQKGEIETDPDRIAQAKRVRCKNNGVTYKSIKEMASDLGINIDKLYSRIRREIYHCDGYEFVILD